MLEESRDYLFQSRLQSLLMSSGLMTLDRLVAALLSELNPGLRGQVAEAMTLKETSFFRDRSPFELLQQELLPGIIRRREAARRLRLWSAACSSGQEAYLLAMLCARTPPPTQWLGGRYSKTELNRGLPARYRIRHMHQAGEGWEVTPDISQLCRFHQCNLCEGPLPMEKFDGILLRNVMLYFPDEVRRKLLLHMHRILSSDGFLILGSSEQPALPGLFQAELKGSACWYRPLTED